MSKNPDTSNKIPPIIAAYEMCMLSPYIAAEANAKTSPTIVQKFGDSPVDANVLPIFSRYGLSESRRLFSIGYFVSRKDSI
jgi:hypothetical protein